MEIKSVWSLEENDSGKRRRKENVVLLRLYPESRERSRVTSTAELPIYGRDGSEELSYAAFLPPVSPCILGCRALMHPCLRTLEVVGGTGASVGLVSTG